MKQGLRNRMVLVSMVLNSEKLVLVCSRAVISRSERNIGAHVDNRLPMVMHSQVDMHRYLVANIHITKTSMTEVISLTVILYCISYYHVYIIG